MLIAQVTDLHLHADAVHGVARRDVEAAAVRVAEGDVGRADLALGLTAHDLEKLGICDEVVPEAVGGAHRGLSQTAGNLAETLGRHLRELRAMPIDALIEARYQKFRAIGHLESAPT